MVKAGTQVEELYKKLPALSQEDNVLQAEHGVVGESKVCDGRTVGCATIEPVSCKDLRLAP